ncbi:MAG: toll/interleukin-1 receptor domain-containing protein [Hyphomonadaceae bacterium]|nr:MAG: hypothetical protein FD160_3538 [Caulobacteraceae bacterium]MBT9446757.1 toll/interleukin-1 receptor domain-containing protein [Hyphomonadaceae bacterium]
MADIFLSYQRRDQTRARLIVKALQAHGYSVFFDPDIRVGEYWSDRLEHEIEIARIVLVLWSASACKSHFVRSEARRGLKQSKLIQAHLEPCNPPLGLDEVESAQLGDWDPRNSQSQEWLGLLSALVRLGVSPARARSTRKKRRALPASAKQIELPFDQPVQRALDESAWSAFCRHWSGQVRDMGAQQLSYYLRNADLGEGWAQMVVATMILFGKAADYDEKAAVRYFEAASKNNWKQADFALGVLYESGIGCRKDLKRAVSAYKRAAKRGHSAAEYHLSLLRDAAPKLTK